MRILLAEDEIDLNHIITLKLQDEGYSVDSCTNGTDALFYLQSADYDAAVLDIMMPGMDGISVLKAARAEGLRVPVLFLTAKDSVQDRVKGLDAGAEDYLIKPFSFEELMARLRVLTRVAHGQTDSVLTIGDLTLDTAAHTVTRAGKPIELSSKEYQLLDYLMHNAGIALSREKIENHIWNFDYEGGTNVVDVYVNHLRKKIDEDSEVKLIRTVRGVGYMMVKL